MNYIWYSQSEEKLILSQLIPRYTITFMLYWSLPGYLYTGKHHTWIAGKDDVHVTFKEEMLEVIKNFDDNVNSAVCSCAVAPLVYLRYSPVYQPHYLPRTNWYYNPFGIHHFGKWIYQFWYISLMSERKMYSLETMNNYQNYTQHSILLQIHWCILCYTITICNGCV